MTEQKAKDITGEVARAFCALNSQFSLIPRTFESNTWWQEVARPDGARLVFHLDTNKTSVGCTSEYPDDIRGRSMSVENWFDDEVPVLAKASVNRTPQAIAKDFTNRVLKKYLSLYERALVLKGAQQARQDDLVRRGNEIRSVCGLEPAAGPNAKIYYPINMSYRVWGENHVGLTLHDLTDDQAKRILAIAMETALPARQWYHSGKYHSTTLSDEKGV